MTMKRYKVLDRDLTSPFQSFQFIIGGKYHCDDFDVNSKNSCSRGFYATGIEGLTYSYNASMAIYECEVSGKSVEIDQYKMRYENIEIIREVSEEEIRKEINSQNLIEKLGYNIELALFPFHPFSIDRTDVTKKEIDLARTCESVGRSIGESVGRSIGESVGRSVWESVGRSIGESVGRSVWESVGESVGRSIGASVGESVGRSVWESVWESVGRSIGEGVWESVWAYISSIFINIEKWEYIDHKKGDNPFQAAIDLWKVGLIVTYDGDDILIFGGKKTKIFWKGKRGYLL